MRLIAGSVLERALVVVMVAGSACAEAKRASAPAAAPLETRVPSCKRATDRPPAGEAALADRPDGADVLVRYSATPRDAPCETLDVAFRLARRHAGGRAGQPGGGWCGPASERSMTARR